MKLRAILLALPILSAMTSIVHVRAEAPDYPVTIQSKPEPLQINLKSTAVIVADMQNAYVSAGGLWDRLGQDISGAGSVVENTRKITEAARLAGVKVIYLKMKLSDRLEDAAFDSPGKHKGIALATMSSRPRHKGRQMIQNPWNEEIVDRLTPRKGDIIIEKRKYSGFSQSTLDETLKTLKIKNLIITGVATNVCVESTLRDAFALDYWPIVVADGVNNVGPQFTQQATLWNIQAFFGWIASTADVLRVLSPDKSQ